MRFRNTRPGRQRKDDSALTSMIDIVFLLLVFFVMTFRVIAPEGDFSMTKMAQAASKTDPHPLHLPPITVRLRAGERGELTAICMNGRELTDFDELRSRVRGLLQAARLSVGDENAPVAEFDCDYGLSYEHVIDAVTAVSGYVEQGRVVELTRKVRFTPPRRQPQG